MLETFLTLTDGQRDFFGILKQIESRFVDSQIDIFLPLLSKSNTLAKISPLVRLRCLPVLILFAKVNEIISDRFHTFSS